MKYILSTIVILLAGHFPKAQVGTDIVLFKMKWKNGSLVLNAGKNITQHKGYDNQPYFHPKKGEIFYASFDDSGRSDIKVFDVKKNSTRNFTLTRDREYSPTLVPDGKYISCILQRDNGVQDLVKYPLAGGEPKMLVNQLKVGYHSWYNNDQVLLFVLEEKDGSTLRLFTSSTGKDTILATNIGRSLHRIPGTNMMSFVQKGKEGNNSIMSVDMSSLTITELSKTVAGQDHLCWLNDQVVIMSDGKSKVFWKKISPESDWKEIIIESSEMKVELKSISRLATNPTNSLLAVVINE